MPVARKTEDIVQHHTTCIAAIDHQKHNKIYILFVDIFSETPTNIQILKTFNYYLFIINHKIIQKNIV